MATTTKKRKAKKVAKARTMGEIVLEQFAETGEVSGLGALADHLDETRPNMAPLAAALRETMTGNRAAVRFFYRHGGFGGGSLWQLSNRFMAAFDLARAERWLKNLAADDLATVEWEEDDDADRSWMEEGEEYAFWGCTVVVTDEHGVEYDASLWGIAEGDDTLANDIYRRIVEAELAVQVLTEMEGK